MFEKDAARVYLVGAGPGDLGLITVRGHELLQTCDCVIYDYLANPELLDLVPTQAERLYVGKISGQPHKTQDEINAIIVAAAKRHLRIVRLKGGDPLLFGRGGEEASVLKHAGIYFEIVPGVTSGLAVPCYAGIPVTHRDCSSSAVFLTGREKAGKDSSSHDWAALASVGTIVCYMGVKAFPEISEQLIKHGKPADTAAAVIQWGTYEKQRVVIGTLADLPERMREKDIGSPSIIVVGEVVNCREDMSWYDQRPLFGKRILVTRSAQQQGTLAKLLRQAGASVHAHASMRIEETSNLPALDAAIESLPDMQWIAFTSQNGVRYFFQRLFARGKDVRMLAHCKIAAVGPATARCLEEFGLRADCVPQSYDSEHLAERLAEREPGKILLPQAQNARPVLAEALSAAGYQVRTVEAYSSVTVANSLDVRSLGLDAVTFASSVTVQRFLEQVSAEGLAFLIEHGCEFIAIGERTAETMRSLQVPVTVVASESTLPGLVQACIQALPPAIE